MNLPSAYQPTELHSRFMYPFFFKRDYLAEATDALKTLAQAAKNKDVAVWDMGETPHELYRQETLPAVQAFLFPSASATDPHCCRYFKVSDNRVNAWFRRGITVYDGKSAFRATLIPDIGIELFLSPDGVGLLSLGLMTHAGPDDTRLDMAHLKRFNYRLVQLHQATAPQLAIPDTRPAAGAAHDANETAAATQAPFLERLGKTGGTFTLAELVGYLLGPLRTPAFDFTPVQDQFSVYTVVRFDKTVDFADAEVRAHLGPLLAGLAQIEEVTYAGALPGDQLDIAHHLMNTRHWAGVAYLGAAHLIADQDPAHPLDAMRVAIVRQKYFIPYLAAFFQRLTLHRLIDAAASAVRAADTSRHEEFRALHEALLDFTVSSLFTEVSSREALNRIYRLAQQGLGVDPAQDKVSGVIQHYEAQLQAEKARALSKELSSNVQTVTHIQRKVEWLEIFFVSFYATELAHLISAAFFSPAYGHGSVLFWPIAAGLLAAWGLQPWAKHEDKSAKHRWVRVVVVTLLLVVIWFAAGFGFEYVASAWPEFSTSAPPAPGAGGH